MQLTVHMNGLECSGTRRRLKSSLYEIDSVTDVENNERTPTVKITYSNNQDLKQIERTLKIFRQLYGVCSNPNPCGNCQKAKNGK